jgi:hypothetical protein
MTLNQITTWQKWTGRIGSFLCILLFLIIIDALVSRFREPLNRFSGLPGSRIAVSGPLAEKTEQIQELTYQINTPDIQLEFGSIETGFWLGGYLWNGTLIISPGIPPGEYLLTVQPKNSAVGKASSPFQIRVYKDLRGFQQNSKSYLVRFLGIKAWQPALGLLLLIVFTFGWVYFLSQKTEILLAKQGKAEIYRVRKGETSCEISFGLGRKQGIQAGSNLLLIGLQGKSLGSIIVGEVFESHSTAQVDPSWKVRPGFMISRP